MKHSFARSLYVLATTVAIVFAAGCCMSPCIRDAYVKGVLASPGDIVRKSRNIATAFDFLRAHDLNALPTGKVEIDGDRVFAFVSEPVLHPFDDPDGLVEVHRRYIDIHVPIWGEETIGYAKLDALPAGVEFNEKDDYALFRVKTTPLTVKPGEFVLFFPPNGAHRPACTMGERPTTNTVRKICVKVKVEEGI